MRIPNTLTSLAEYGIIEEVLRPLMSGKEAQIYSVRSQGEYRVAKVYKEANNRTFKNRADYTEGRKVRNSRDQRAMSTGSRHGRAQTEAAWRTTEVEMIYRLRDAGVRVPEPYHFIDGVLVMEMITDEHGEPAPRLGDVVLEREAAQAVFDRLLAEVVRMLAAGVVHGDLSDFNVLMGADGPVIIDFPQAVDASSNHNARKLLLRDVDNLHRYMARFIPERKALPYAQEMWALYERGQLMPDTKLTGRYQASEKKISTEAVLGLISDATRDERRRREHLGLSMRGAADEVAAEAPPRPPSRYAQKREAQIAARKAAAAAAPPPAQHTLPRDARPHPAQPRQRDARSHPAEASQRDARSNATHATQRDARPGGAHASQRDARPNTPHASQRDARPNATHVTQRDARPNATHVTQRDARPNTPHASQRDARPNATHVTQRDARPNTPHAPFGGRGADQGDARNAPREDAVRARGMSGPHSAAPQPQQGAGQVGGGEAAQKRRRRRRKRKTNADT